MKSLILLFVSFSCVICSRGPALPCDATQCQLPNCRCSSTDIPGGLSRHEVPQIVVISFNEALTVITDQVLKEIFDGQYLSSNGCNFRATHFVSHPNSDYSLINKWWSLGHEIASISLTHTNNITYWARINSTGWHLEMDGMRTILTEFGKIPFDEIKGVRSPNLQNGGDLQMVMMKSDDFLYDSSMPSKAYGGLNIGRGMWPYSFDYESTQDCEIEPCVYSSFPGIWEIPVLELENDFGITCSFLGGCIGGFTDADPQLVFKFFLRNFERVYGGNRAPFPLHTQAATLQHKFFYEGYLMFLKYLTSLPDVYVVTMQEALEYVRNPVRLSDIDSFKPFQCNHIPRPGNCSMISRCRYTDSQLPLELQGLGERYMTICGNKCPPRFPWIGNPLGE